MSVFPCHLFSGSNRPQIRWLTEGRMRVALSFSTGNGHANVFLAGLELVYQCSAPSPSEGATRAARASSLAPVYQGRLVHRPCTIQAIPSLNFPGPLFSTPHDCNLALYTDYRNTCLLCYIEYPGCTQRMIHDQVITDYGKGVTGIFMYPPPLL